MEEINDESTGTSTVVDRALGRLLAPSRVYIVEHFVVLATITLIVVSAAGLFNGLIDYFIKADPDPRAGYSTYDIVTSGIGNETIILNVSIALVALPAFLILYIRSRKAERLHSDLLENRARRRLGYVWLMVALLFIIGYTVALVNTTLRQILGFDDLSTKLWAAAVLKQLFSVTIIALAALLIARLTPGLSRQEGGAK